MALNIYSTAVLNYVLRELRMPPSFLLDAFFTSQQQFETEELHFDVETLKFRLSPWVSPLSEGQIVESIGLQEKIVKPAYIKDKRQYNPNRAVKRSIGENIGGQMSAEERMRASIRQDMEDQLRMLTTRLEWMAAHVLRSGSLTIFGNKYPQTVVSFGRNATHTVVLTGGAKWDQAGVNPLNDLETWAQLCFADSGSMPRTVVMDPMAWKTFRQNSFVKEELDLHRNLNAQPTLANDIPITIGGQLMGTLSYFNIWTYSGTFHDDNLVPQKFLPDGTVLMVGDIAGTRLFGAIRDVRQLRAVQFYVKSWIEEDPSIEWTMLQSAPLLVPFRPDASLGATVL